MSQETKPSEPTAKPEEPRPLPYERPRLTFLGNMREITLASNGAQSDSIGNGLQP